VLEILIKIKRMGVTDFGFGFVILFISVAQVETLKLLTATQQTRRIIFQLQIFQSQVAQILLLKGGMCVGFDPMAVYDQPQRSFYHES
jgi:hypothetical protein